jgi:hypothetical protein
VGGERATGTGAKLVEAETMESMVLRVRSEESRCFVELSRSISQKV